MDLTKKYIHMNREKGKAVTQITLDDDFNVPDMKPDLIRIILDKGEHDRGDSFSGESCY